MGIRWQLRREKIGIPQNIVKLVKAILSAEAQENDTTGQMLGQWWRNFWPLRSISFEANVEQVSN